MRHPASPEDAPPATHEFFEVSDTRHGMDEETRVRILEPFFRTTFTGRAPGMPAVLSIVRGL